MKAATEEAVAIIDADDGIMALAAAVGETAATAMDTPGEASVSMYAKQVMAASDKCPGLGQPLPRKDAAAVTAQDDIEVAKTLLNIVNGKFAAAMNGVEVSNMGGASDAYVSAQRMATFTLPAPAGAVAAPITGDTYVPMAMQVMLFVAMTLLIGGGAMLYRERRLGSKA